MNKFLVIVFLFCFSLQAYGFEDCIISAKERLTNIEIEDNTIIDVYPIVTIMNEKNTLMVHPLKEGVTYFTVKKNKKEKEVFYVKVNLDETIISQKEGFTIMSLDEPPPSFEIDLPPLKLNNKEEQKPELRGGKL